MKSDNHYVIRHLTAFFVLVTFTIFAVSGQSSAGIFKIFSDKPLVVYVDELHCPQYSEIQLVPGTHYVKAINSEGVQGQLLFKLGLI